MSRHESVEPSVVHQGNKVAPTREEQVKEIIRCGKDPAYFTKKYVKIQHATKGTIPFQTYPFQDDCLKDFQKNRLNVVLKSRQLGLSTICAAYAVWDAIFHRDRNILVIATKLDTAINFIKKVKFMVTSIPKWLLLTKFEDNKRSIRFNNGSQITAIPTSPDAGRSEAISLLVVDECVGGDAKVKIRDKFTKEEIEISIQDLYLMLKLENEINTGYIYLSD